MATGQGAGAGAVKAGAASPAHPVSRANRVESMKKPRRETTRFLLISRNSDPAQQWSDLERWAGSCPEVCAQQGLEQLAATGRLGIASNLQAQQAALSGTTAATQNAVGNLLTPTNITTGLNTVGKLLGVPGLG